MRGVGGGVGEWSDGRGNGESSGFTAPGPPFGPPTYRPSTEQYRYPSRAHDGRVVEFVEGSQPEQHDAEQAERFDQRQPEQALEEEGTPEAGADDHGDDERADQQWQAGLSAERQHREQDDTGGQPDPDRQF